MIYKFSTKAEAVKDSKAPYGKQINDANDIVNFCRPLFQDIIAIKERLIAVYLNNANKVTGYYVISEGNTNSTLFDNKSTLLHAVNTLASSCILVHNHPSGNNKPSAQDLQGTKKLNEALRLVDCELIDHIILTDENYFSFSNEGLC